MTDSPLTLGIDVGGTSVKLAAIAGRSIVWTSKGNYQKPTTQQILAAVREAAAGRAREVRSVGVCVPGVLDEHRQKVVFSANLPGLHGLVLEELASAGTESKPEQVRVVNDALASAWDIHATRHPKGRLLVLALGTGVGASVLDEGIPLRVDGDSPGHIGQIDVSIEGAPIVAPDGGAGGLEGYIGAAALRHRYGHGPIAPRLHIEDPPAQALVRAIRICHALYRPHHIVLAGGLGIRLGHLLPALRHAIQHQLTKLARPGWTFSTGDSDHHAACGAARLAGMQDFLTAHD